ncbi:hypothetical protein Dsin_000114 [Dipteronia sinensis]|uniref:Glycosyltransferase n=1 Tax=Dipteronia sinensis TaxID=43782 RepID=A0AAD9ZJL7_9ROSI|nr:hypothetical protein Dsin_000114 [Dipteronia sinensis]
MGNPHVLVIPFPAYGHISSLLKLSLQLVHDHGIKVTFVITEVNRQRVMHSLATSDGIESQIRLVSIPDDGPKSQETLFEEHAFSSLSGKVKQLIEQINASDSDKITCIVADFLLGWGMQMAAERGVKGVVFSSALASLVLISKIPNLIDDGIIDDDGNVIKKEMIKLSPTMPPMSSSHFPWASLGIPKLQKLFFEHTFKNNESLKLADWVLCNSAYELDPETFDTEPKIRPIGPLLGRLSNQLSTNSRPEDSICLEWLDQQPPQSVIYVAFGTIAVLNQTEFEELALGLELCNRPFLWAVRSDITENLKDAYPDGFEERVGSRGLMTSWSPQKKVLEHPSIACFLSHCGWNSVLEALSNGIPLLCWPTFADQFMNESYICNVWKIGLRLDRDHGKIITRQEIKNKVEELLSNEMYKANALVLKEKLINTIKETGSSYNNLKGFVEWVKE